MATLAFILSMAPFITAFQFAKPFSRMKNIRTYAAGASQPIEIEQIDNVARAAARKAGELISAGIGTIDLTRGVEAKTGTRDIVTEVDKQAQKVIEETIRAAFPDHKFLGEEDVAPGIEASTKAMESFKNEEHLWIVGKSLFFRHFRLVSLRFDRPC